MKKLIKKKFVVYFKDGSKYYSPWTDESDEVVVDSFDRFIVYKIKVIEKIDDKFFPRYKSYIYRFNMQ